MLKKYGLHCKYIFTVLQYIFEVVNKTGLLEYVLQKSTSDFYFTISHLI